MNDSARATVGVIGGTGMEALLDGGDAEMVATPYGTVGVIVGRVGDQPAAFLARHGAHHALLPHEVDYRANLWALRSLGVTRVLSTVAVGSLRADLRPGDLALLSDFLDLTHTRPSSFRGAPQLPAAVEFYHVDMQPPYCPHLRARLRQASDVQGSAGLPDAVYACVEGPRYETPAEIGMLARLGADVVGMTGIPEAVLAREIGLCYGSIAVITNAAAGLGDEPLLHEDVERRGAAARGQVSKLLAAAAGQPAGAEEDCCPAAARRKRWAL